MIHWVQSKWHLSKRWFLVKKEAVWLSKFPEECEIILQSRTFNEWSWYLVFSTLKIKSLSVKFEISKFMILMLMYLEAISNSSSIIINVEIITTTFVISYKIETVWHLMFFPIWEISKQFPGIVAAIFFLSRKLTKHVIVLQIYTQQQKFHLRNKDFDSSMSTCSWRW